MKQIHKVRDLYSSLVQRVKECTEYMVTYQVIISEVLSIPVNERRIRGIGEIACMSPKQSFDQEWGICDPPEVAGHWLCRQELLGLGIQKHL